MTNPIDLGHFSISLTVKDIAAAESFYRTLGFARLDGDGKRWLILRNGEAKIGLFQGMFEANLVTFNPPDARAVERGVKAGGYVIDKPCEDGEGPAHFVVKDPDGNMILVDQH